MKDLRGGTSEPMRISKISLASSASLMSTLFNNTITQLQNNGLVVFDQMPFEIPMQILKNKFSKEKILKEMLNDFYIPIIESKMASTYYFIPNWESSSGSKWEHKKAKEFGIEIVYLE